MVDLLDDLEEGEAKTSQEKFQNVVINKHNVWSNLMGPPSHYTTVKLENPCFPPSNQMPRPCHVLPGNQPKLNVIVTWVVQANHAAASFYGDMVQRGIRC